MMGHNPNTITSANSIILFRCIGVYDNWVKLEGYEVDNAASFTDVTLAETQMGVDGKQSIGFVPHETPVTLNFAANSASVDVMENVYNDFIQNMEVRYCEIQITYPSVNRRQNLKGTMVTKNGGTSIARLLQGHTYTFNQVSNGIENI